MFFPERLKSIGQNDLVLEIGPGGSGHPRADLFLEKRFDDPKIAEGQRGFAQPLKTSKQIVLYGGGTFPFRDEGFDYLICSHVLEHVDNVDTFVGEMLRVAKKGYLEYPTIYYDYLYNFPQHTTLLFKKGNMLYWMPKAEAGLDRFLQVQEFFYESFRAGYKALVDELRYFLFQGFEWEGFIVSKRASSLVQLCYGPEELEFPVRPKDAPREIDRNGLLQRVTRLLSRALNKAQPMP